MWAWVAGIVLGEHVTGLQGAWLGVALLWRGLPFRRAVFWLTTGAVMGGVVQTYYAVFALPTEAYQGHYRLAFTGCQSWESPAHGGLAGRACTLSESPWPAWEGVRLDLFCNRCRQDTVPSGGFVAEARLKPVPYWRNQGSYSVPVQWLSPARRAKVIARTLYFGQGKPLPEPFRPARGRAHEPSISALTLGRTRDLSPEQWQILADSGLMHLLVVSGLHVGALLGAWAWAMNHLRRRLGLGERQWRLPLLVSSTVLLGAYVVLTGAGIPVMRAAFMGLAGLVVWVFRLWQRPYDLLLAAMGAVLLLVPGAPWTPGFWLSFSLTAAILLSVLGRVSGFRSKISGAVSLQFRLSIITVLLLGGLFHQVPVMSFPANLLMIPWVVGVVFPVSSAGVLTSLFWPELSGALFALADQAFEVFWSVARWAADYGTFWLPVSAGWAIAVLPLVLICLVRLRLWVLLVLVLTGWLASQRYHRPPVSLTLLDVGQGSAAVVQVGERFWLIDSGTERAGRQVVGPWLRWHGVQNLTVIASHADSDHVGGMAPVLARWPESPRWAAQPPDSSWQRCRAGTVFYHQGPVVLEALWPDDRLPQAAPDNAHSCVVRLKVADWQILMPGDLTRRWQYALTARLPRSDHTLWVVPHHGAANGLNPRFWRAVNPEIAFVSADRNSPYGHPAPVVVDWLAKAGIPVLNTATSGQIGILWPAPDQPPRVRTMDKSGH